MDHIELLQNAFVNYLKPLQSGNPLASVWTAGLLILPGENNLDKDGSRIVAYIEGGEMGEEDPPCSGNRWADVILELRTPVSKLSAKEKTAGKAEPILGHQANATALRVAVLDAALPDLISAAIDGFTCFGIANRTQISEQDDNYWMNGWKIRLLSCPSTIPN